MISKADNHGGNSLANEKQTICNTHMQMYWILGVVVVEGIMSTYITDNVIDIGFLNLE